MDGPQAVARLHLQQSVRAVAPIGPAGVGQDGIPAQPGYRHSGPCRRVHLRRDMTEPRGAGVALDARLGQEHRLAVAGVQRSQHVAERTPARVAQLQQRAAVDALVVPVVVGANQVHHVGTAAQVRLLQPGQHVPGFPLRPYGVRRALRRSYHSSRGSAGLARHDMDHGVAHQHPRARRRVPHRMDRGDRGAHKLALQLPPAAPRPRVHARHVGAGPGEVGDLVDRAHQRRPPGLLQVQPGKRAGIDGKAVHELPAERVQPVRPAVVAQVPGHVDARRLRPAQQRQHRPPVPAARRAGLHQVPPHPVPRAAYAETRERRIVLRRKQVVPAGRDHVQPAAVAAAVGRALEPARQGAREERSGPGCLHLRQAPRGLRRS